jgi:hemoglobin-like flavoprotein
MFALEPRARAMFKFTDGEDIRTNSRVRSHARAMVDRIDMAIGFLGPDFEMLEEDLKAMGKRHSAYGVPPEYLPVMGKALINALEKALKDNFTTSDKQAWEEVFELMVKQMTLGMKV